MDGKITGFNDDEQQGTIISSDGQQYAFSLNDWRGRGLPSPGIPVRFDIRESQAVHVLNLPEKQRRASGRVITSEPGAKYGSSTHPARYSGWAIGAVVTAMLGLFFDMAAPLVGLLAILIALLGLRQIRREPQRYRGRFFCWSAIVLAVIIATLSLFLAPLPEAQASRDPTVSDASFTK